MRGGAWRFCWYCGGRFWSVRDLNAFCSEKHRMRQWRAIKVLEGTHGYVKTDASWANHRWKRLPVEGTA